jgi:aldehyde:ferredoxin oxidoreductase
VKGKELAAHDPRGDKIRAYSYTMGTCGGDHHEGQGPQALGMTAMADSLCICSFTNFLVYGAGTDKIITDMMNPLCGWNWKTEDYWTTCKRIMTTERVFNVREGISSKDDRLPIRMYKEKLPAGPRKDAIFTDADQKDMETKTYGFFGWDAKGIPTEATLKAYGLDYLIADVNAAKKKYNL